MGGRYNDNDGCGFTLWIIGFSIIFSLAIILIKLHPIIFFLSLFLLIWLYINRKSIKNLFLTKEQKIILLKEKQEIEAIAAAKKEKAENRQILLSSKRLLQDELNNLYRQRNEIIHKINLLKIDIDKIQDEALAYYRWNYYHSIESELCEIDNYDGKNFENFIARLYTKLGYTITHMSKSSDQGGDLVVKKGNLKTAIQAKRWKNKIGNSAVQEVLGAMHYYGCQEGIVITSSYFTREAIALAKSANIILIDRDYLGNMCHKFYSQKDIPFDRVKYEKISTLVKHIQVDEDQIEYIIWDVIMKGGELHYLYELQMAEEQKSNNFKNKIDEQTNKVKGIDEELKLF